MRNRIKIPFVLILFTMLVGTVTNCSIPGGGSSSSSGGSAGGAKPDAERSDPITSIEIGDEVQLTLLGDVIADIDTSLGSVTVDYSGTTLKLLGSGPVTVKLPLSLLQTLRIDDTAKATLNSLNIGTLSVIVLKNGELLSAGTGSINNLNVVALTGGIINLGNTVVTNLNITLDKTASMVVKLSSSTTKITGSITGSAQLKYEQNGLSKTINALLGGILNLLS